MSRLFEQERQATTEYINGGEQIALGDMCHDIKVKRRDISRAARLRVSESTTGDLASGTGIDIVRRSDMTMDNNDRETPALVHMELCPSMPDGSMDWAWWHTERNRLESIIGKGICVSCQITPSDGRMVVCEPCWRTRRMRREYSLESPPRCAFCGRRYGTTEGSEASQASWPVTLRKCHDCRDRPIPDQYQRRLL